MTVRFSMLQAHYRSTLDFSNDALKAAEKGYKRLMTAQQLLENLQATEQPNAEDEAAVNKILVGVYAGMNNDFNAAQTIAELSEAATMINTWNDKHNKVASVSAFTLERLKQTYSNFLFDIFGLRQETEGDNSKLSGVMDLVIDIRKDARSKKDFATSDKIRDALQAVGIQLKDSKDGTTWENN